MWTPKSHCRVTEVFLLRQGLTIGLLATAVALSAMAFVFLPCPLSIVTAILGIMMILAAEIDARTMLLPDSLTLGAALVGVLTVPLFDMNEPRIAIGEALLRGISTALVLGLLRRGYSLVRGVEGLGLGDVKLALAIGIWLPIEDIPICFGLASLTALISIAVRRNSQPIGPVKLPFGAFLCPSLWLLVFFNFVSQS